MAAFSSSSPSHFLIDSVFLQNNLSTINNNNGNAIVCGLLEEPNNNDNITTNNNHIPTCFSHFYYNQLPVENNITTPKNLDQSTNVSALSNNEPSVLSITNKNSIDSSSIVSDKYDFGVVEQVINQKVTTPPIINKKRKFRLASVANSAQSKDMREVKGKKAKKMTEGEEQNKLNEEKKAKEAAAPKGYIHVRARRGQATDSHSLAERVRRERISERMKLLQSIVPGCDKVTGKALMLDEIINYVQSLQHQVEFLSLKLASVNPMFYDFGVDLESFMVRPDQDLSNLPSPLPNIQTQSSPTPVNNHPFFENNSANPILFQHAQIPNALPQVNRQELWELDEQRQKFMNQSGFSNNLFSFH